MNTLCILLFILTNKYLFAKAVDSQVINELPSSFIEIVNLQGHSVEKFDVETEDGYLLGLFRIQGTQGLPILLMHGVLDTSDSWVLRGNGSLGITLANKGYDVWFGNVRGNKYSRRHVKLNPDTNMSFWDYSFHEHGYYDLPAMIDTILSVTNAKKLNAFGHSQGNAIFYVLGSTRPEYNEKINVMTALAPICYLNHIPPPLSVLIQLAPEIYAFAKAIGLNELFGDVSPLGILVNVICSKLPIGYSLCGLDAIFPTTGFDTKELQPPFFKVALNHYPAATSSKNLNHLAQVSLEHSFSRYDYGPTRNLLEYKSVTPPNYNLSDVTMPIVLLAGRNDKVSVLADVATLKAQLPNVINYTILKHRLMNHLDFTWGEHMYNYLFPYIFKILEINN